MPTQFEKSSVLERTEAYLAEAEALSHTGSWAWNVATGHLYWSGEHFRIFGFEPGEVQPSYDMFFQMVHPDDRSVTKQNFDAAVQDRSKCQVEYRIVRRDGVVKQIHSISHPLLDGSDEVTEYVGTVIDCTERRETEAKLKESEKRFRQLVESIPHHVWSFRTDGTLGYWNQQLVDYTGLTTEELHNGGWAALHPGDVERIQEAWRQAWARSAPYEQEHRIRGHDGKYRRFLCRAVPFKDDGKQEEWFGTDTDIEDRKHAEEELHMAQNELAHMARVTVMGELAASIAHDVNQPLSAAVSNGGACLQWLSGSEPNIDEARAAAAQVVEQGIRASEVVASIRALIKKSAPQLAVVNLNEIVRDVLSLVRYEILRNEISLRTELAHDLAPARGDPVQLKQVLANLIINAIEAIKARGEGPKELVILTQNLEPTEVIIAVRDSGVGIAPQRVEEVFKPYVTNKPEGMGMGLTISRSIIEAHGGRILAKPNQEMRGAIFQCILPRADV